MPTTWPGTGLDEPVGHQVGVQTFVGENDDAHRVLHSSSCEVARIRR